MDPRAGSGPGAEALALGPLGAPAQRLPALGQRAQALLVALPVKIPHVAHVESRRQVSRAAGVRVRADLVCLIIILACYIDFFMYVKFYFFSCNFLQCRRQLTP